MRNGILAVVALTACGVAMADPPSQPAPPQQPVPPQIVEDLNSLRQEMGATNSSPAEFAQAVQNIAERQRHIDGAVESWAQAWADDGAPQPTQNTWNPGPTPQPAPTPGYVVPAGNVAWPQLQPGPPAPPPGPPVPGPPGHPKPPRPPKVLLEDTAFDLERMAHELDKADLYGEADALRGAAARLRMSARQHKKPDGRPMPPPPLQSTLGPGPAPVEHPHAAERARRAIQQADERTKQLERQLADAQAQFQRQAAEFSRQMRDAHERIQRAHEEAIRARHEAPEGPQRPQERRRERGGRPDHDRSHLPPPGVHGGPTDPPPPPHLAPGH